MPDPKSSCCAPAAQRTAIAPVQTLEKCGPRDENAVRIPGGEALIGTRKSIIPDDGESPLRRRKLRPFLMARDCVSNAQFDAFVKATGYVSEAERFGWSYVFWAQVPETVGPTQAVQEVQWWRRVEGANWRNINGPGTMASAWHEDHPVVQVSWHDAKAYADWVGGRLPDEGEWEHASRAGQGDVRFPWGDAEPDDHGLFPCNIWQGRFPEQNTGADGFVTTAPIGSFAPNGYGLFNMVGNVWEWTSAPFKVRSLRKSARSRWAGTGGYKLLKGGSFLCHRSYCYRYRIAARSGNSPDSTTTHQGFRVIWDI